MVKRNEMAEEPQIVVTAGALELWRYKSCEAEIGVGDNWATVYLIESGDKRKGHATKLLQAAKAHYEGKGLFFGGSVALNMPMRALYQKLGIYEYV